MPVEETASAKARAQSMPPIRIAKDKPSDVKEELTVVDAELQLTNAALDRCLPADVKQGDVGKALEQNGKVQQKVKQATEDLAEVTELLEEEIGERRRLEAELAARTDARGMSENG